MKPVFSHDTLLAYEKLDRVQKILPYLRDKDSLLDVGAGQQHLKALLPGVKYTGIDDLESWPKKRYSAITVLEVIEHIDNLGLFLEQCYEHLVREGLLVISTPYACSIYNVLRNGKYSGNTVVEYKRDGTECEHVVAFDSLTLKRLLLKNKFSLIKVVVTRNRLWKGQSIIVIARKAS